MEEVFMVCKISENNIEEIEHLFAKANEKLTRYPSDSKFLCNLHGKCWIPHKTRENLIVPISMLELETQFIIQNNKYKYIGKLSVDVNGYYSIESVERNKINCPYYWIKKPLKCDCCKISTNRKMTYIVENMDKRFLHQVGKECLNRFTNSKMLEEIKCASNLCENILIYQDRYEEPATDFISVDFVLNTIIELDSRNGKTDRLKSLVIDSITYGSTQDVKGEYSPYNKVFSKVIVNKTDALKNYYKNTRHKNTFVNNINELLASTEIKRSDIGKLINAFEYYINSFVK